MRKVALLLIHFVLPSCCAAAEIKKQRDFYQKLGMDVPGDIKGELNNMKTHLDQRNGTSHHLQPQSASPLSAEESTLTSHQCW